MEDRAQRKDGLKYQNLAGNSNVTCEIPYRYNYYIQLYKIFTLINHPILERFLKIIGLHSMPGTRFSNTLTFLHMLNSHLDLTCAL